jgi:hypothetical protein
LSFSYPLRQFSSNEEQGNNEVKVSTDPGEGTDGGNENE